MPRDRLAPLPIPSRKGRLAIITGANSGIGYAAARALGQAGADVVLAVRNAERGEEAMHRLRSEAPYGNYRVVLANLGDLASVRALASQFEGKRVDILINNAGISGRGAREETVDGFEKHLGVNYLGHFALTGLLLPSLAQSPRPRVVNLGSLMARRAKLDLNDLQLTRRYDAGRAYANSKLALIMFARELQRRSGASVWGVIAHAAHPGWADTGIFPRKGPVRIGNGLGSLFGFFQTATDGAQPIVFAAASRRAVGGAYYGPITRFGTAGPVGRVRLPRQARNDSALRKLWDLSEELTEVAFPEPTPVL